MLCSRCAGCKSWKGKRTYRCSYDSVHRALLWKVLARFGITPQIMKVIRQFHKMRACVRGYDGQYLESFEVAQWRCQGCVVSPLVFSVVALEADSAGTRTYSQIFPTFKSSRQMLALKRHWNVRGVLFGGCCKLMTRVSCRGRRAGWRG
ncbi:unnamed protein product [Ascophyllum nodosum]